jgi:hypothetical protein
VGCMNSGGPKAGQPHTCFRAHSRQIKQQQCWAATPTVSTGMRAPTAGAAATAMTTNAKMRHTCELRPVAGTSNPQAAATKQGSTTSQGSQTTPTGAAPTGATTMQPQQLT